MQLSLLVRAYLAVLTATSPLVGHTQEKEPIKIGIIYDLTGPFAEGGSVDGAIGTDIAIEMINERGGVAGRPVVPIVADSQSKVEVAINEAERLWAREGVDVVMGLYLSAQCVPLAQRADALKKLLWTNICIASSVLKDKHLQYAFRVQAHSDQFGEASVRFLAENSEDKLGVRPEDLKVAIVYEDSAYGVGVAASNERWAEEFGIDVVLKEGYAATAPDLSPLVTKLRRARPDVILHTGLRPDITLFLRQAREMGLKFKVLIGHAAGYSQLDHLREALGSDVDYFFNVTPAAAHLLAGATLEEGLPGLIDEMEQRYKGRTGAREMSPHVSSGFNPAWVLLHDVMPRALDEYGGVDPDALRQAALETDIPEGGTIQGYGVKFYQPEHEMAGQNARSFPVVMQYIGPQANVVWPESMATAEPVLPLPEASPYAVASWKE